MISRRVLLALAFSLALTPAPAADADAGPAAPVAAIYKRVVESFDGKRNNTENGYFITPLVDILEKHSRKEKKVAELTGQKFEAQLMLVADQTTPYRLLTEVLYSCGQAGYANYRLLVLKSKD